MNIELILSTSYVPTNQLVERVKAAIQNIAEDEQHFGDWPTATKDYIAELLIAAGTLAERIEDNYNSMASIAHVGPANKEDSCPE